MVSLLYGFIVSLLPQIEATIAQFRVVERGGGGAGGWGAYPIIPALIEFLPNIKFLIFIGVLCNAGSVQACAL